MAKIKPFRGYRYNTEKAGMLEDLVTPPYDVINENAEKAYISRNRYNIIRLDITKNKPNVSGADSNRYLEPELLLNEWVKKNILIQDHEESIYCYDIDYSLPGKDRIVRRGFVCLVELREFREGIVKPHEKTFPGVINDRLELTRRCRAQFSKVFGVYSDKEKEIIAALDSAERVSAGSVMDADGHLHKIEKVTDPVVISKISESLKEKCIYIADGHHRYTTALSYRNELREQGLISEKSPENFIMMYLTPVEDSGLTILPTHRLVVAEKRFAIADFINSMKRFFTIEEIKGGSREILAAGIIDAMKEASEADDIGNEHVCLGFYFPEEDRGWVLKLASGIESILSDMHPSVRTLDANIVAELVLDRVLQLDISKSEKENLVSYYSDMAEIIDDSVKKSVHDHTATPLVFLMNPTRIEQVLEVCDASQVMPHKSTYFYPKIISGLVLNLFASGSL